MNGLFSNCTDSSWAWLDPGCLLQSAGSAVGSSVTSALEPVWIVLAIVFAILLLIAFAPNVRHIVPAFL